jgi:hypothetical protein
MEIRGEVWLGEEQPQWVAAPKRNLRRRSLLQTKAAAVSPTKHNATRSCQSIP